MLIVVYKAAAYSRAARERMAKIKEAEKKARLLRNKEMRIFAVRAGIRGLEKDVAVDSLWETDAEIKEETTLTYPWRALSP